MEAQLTTDEQEPVHFYAHYTTYEKRLSTFQAWPVQSYLSPEELASAGFFYKGRSDQVYCFSCGYDFGYWLKNENPWERHASESPKCIHIRNEKGVNYATAVRATRQTAEDEPPVSPLEPLVLTSELALEEPQLQMCKLCLNRTLSIMFLPCAHLISCAQCAAGLATCPTCRKNIKSTAEIQLNIETEGPLNASL